MSTLAGILVMVSYNMSEWRSFKALLRNSRSDVAVLLTTFFLTVIIDLTVAIQFGLLLAVLLFLKRLIETTQVDVIKQAVDDDQSDFSDEVQQLQVPKDVEVFEISGPFFLVWPASLTKPNETWLKHLKSGLYACGKSRLLMQPGSTTCATLFAAHR